MWTSSTDTNFEYSEHPTLHVHRLYTMTVYLTRTQRLVAVSANCRDGRRRAERLITHPSPKRVAGGGWSRRKVGTCACASSHRDTLPSCIQPLSTKSISSLLTSIVSLARPLTHSVYHHLDHDFCVLTNNTAVRLKTRRAPRSIVGTLPRDLVTSTRSSLGCCVDPSWFAGYSKRLLGEAKTRRSSSAALAKEESQAKLLSRASNRCFAASRSRRILTHLRWPCFTDD